MTCQANYYDLQSSEAYPVTLSAASDGLHIHIQQQSQQGNKINKLWLMAEVQVSERLGSAPRTLRHKTQGFCEVTDLAGLEVLLKALNHQPSILEVMQHSTSAMLASVAIFIVILGLSYLIGLPVAAKVIAMQLPQKSLQMLDSGTLTSLDNYKILTPSKLSAQRQLELTNSFAALVEPKAKNSYQLIFRASEKMGANAFALPSGTIVLLDELVALTADDKELLGVLGHELGHVQNRHAARMVLQTSIVGLAATWWLGDVSSLLAAAPAAILGAKYSRDMEREADSYGIALMQNNGLSSCYLASILGKLEENFKQKQAAMMSEKQHDKAKSSHQSEPKASTKDNGILSQMGSYLSSHPATPERMKALCPAG